MAVVAGGGVAILLGNDDGTFQPHVDSFTGFFPFTVTAGDFNGDGKLDLAVAECGPFSDNFCGNGPPTYGGTASILLGRGDGTFPTHVDYGIPFPTGSLIGGDFNNDNGLDLAVAELNCTSQPCPPNGGVSVLLNPVIALFPAQLAFGKQPVGSTSGPETVLLSDPSPAPVKISSIAINGADPADFAQSNTCGTKILPGANCTVSVTFTPKASGTRTAALVINDNALARQQMVGLKGVGGGAGVRFIILEPNFRFRGA